MESFRSGLTDVIVKIFDSYIEISNPGSLYGNLSIDLLNTDQYQPKHRNRLLAEAFYLMGEVEKHGTGLIRVRNWIKDYNGLEFIFLEQSGSMVGKLAFNNSENFTENFTKNKRHTHIINYIDKNSKITTETLSKLLGVSRQTIATDINILKQ